MRGLSQVRPGESLPRDSAKRYVGLEERRSDTGMADILTITLLVLSAAAQVLLMLMAVYFAVRIARAVGTFWAWILMVAAFFLLTMRNVFSLALTLSLPPEELSALIERLGPASIWPNQIISVAAAVLLVFATYGIQRIFEKPKKAQSDTNQT